MQILNKAVNIRDDVCYKVTSTSRVCDVNKDYVKRIMDISDELHRENKSIANIDDFSNANRKTLVRIKKMEDVQRLQRNAGFALVGSITLIGTLVTIIIIFMVINLLILR